MRSRRNEWWVQWWASRRRVWNINKMLLLTTVRQIWPHLLIRVGNLRYIVCAYKKEVWGKQLSSYQLEAIFAVNMTCEWLYSSLSIPKLNTFYNDQWCKQFMQELTELFLFDKFEMNHFSLISRCIPTDLKYILWTSVPWTKQSLREQLEEEIVPGTHVTFVLLIKIWLLW